MEDQNRVVARFDSNRSCTFTADSYKTSKGFWDLGIDFWKYNLERLNSEEVKQEYSADVIGRTREKWLKQLQIFNQKKETAPDSIEE